MNYQQQNLRKDLNGLRFISIVAVILYHSKISFFNSGFIGVDIFFVLSGFFITQILLNQNKSNNLDILLTLNLLVAFWGFNLSTFTVIGKAGNADVSLSPTSNVEKSII